VDINRMIMDLKDERRLLDTAIKAVEGVRSRKASGGPRGKSQKVVSIESGNRPRRLSAAARRRISEAQKRRWAKIKRVA
jgi:hypothetical protein